MYEAGHLRRLIEEYGVELLASKVGPFVFDAVAFRGHRLNPPVQISLNSDEAVAAYVSAAANVCDEQGTSPLFETVMMEIVELLETSNPDDTSAFEAVGLEWLKDGGVVWRQKRRPYSAPEMAEGDFGWIG